MSRGKHRKQHIQSKPQIQTPPISEKQQEIVDLKKKFIELYPEHGNIGDTLKVIGLKSRNSFYDWEKNDPEFKSAFEDVKKNYVETLEREADRRAVEGVNKPVYQQGKLVGTVKEYSDTLLIFRLKALAPDKYRERTESKVDLTSGGKPIESVTRVVDA